MSDKKTAGIIPACLIVDDFPFNVSSWRRVQYEAFGYRRRTCWP